MAAARREVAGAALRTDGLSGKERIRRYFEERVGDIVYGEELAAASGILAWSRRVRELREEGMAIEELGGSRYRLARLPDN
jgi:biotin operon repressor